MVYIAIIGLSIKSVEILEISEISLFIESMIQNMCIENR